MTYNPLDHFDRDYIGKIADAVAQAFPREVAAMNKHEAGLEVVLDREQYLELTFPIDRFIYQTYSPTSTSAASHLMFAVRLELRRRQGL
jgi:hypothetical protein